jgi:hypothetical protein
MLSVQECYQMGLCGCMIDFLDPVAVLKNPNHDYFVPMKYYNKVEVMRILLADNPGEMPLTALAEFNKMKAEYEKNMKKAEKLDIKAEIARDILQSYNLSFDEEDPDIESHYNKYVNYNNHIRYFEAMIENIVDRKQRRNELLTKLKLVGCEDKINMEHCVKYIYLGVGSCDHIVSTMTEKLFYEKHTNYLNILHRDYAYYQYYHADSKYELQEDAKTDALENWYKKNNINNRDDLLNNKQIPDCMKQEIIESGRFDCD